MESDREKYKNLSEELTTKTVMLEAELKVSKEFIVKQERMYESLEQLKDQKDQKIDELRGKITELEIDASDK